MSYHNIKRNSMDIILTDILPVEISELFTYKNLYDYLFLNNESLTKVIQSLVKVKSDTNKKQRLFQSNKWLSVPLKFSIYKNQDSTRELNVLQPLAAIQIFLFVTLFEKELLSTLNEKAIFSLRYHKKENELYYRSKRKHGVGYFNREYDSLNRRIIEQSGMYFNIAPYRSIVAFTNSEKWFDLNLKFKYFAKLDYKACFESIYTHSYKWLISRDVNDSKGFQNTNLFTTIDRLLQNINASTSNGVVVGPEFSRMIAEVLMQGIDYNVYNTLLNSGFVVNENYSISRYVDDIFIFSESEELIEKIIGLFNEKANKYMIRLNELKITRKKLPTVLNEWHRLASQYATNIGNAMFYTEKEIKSYDYGEIPPYKFKAYNFLRVKSALKKEFNDLICMYEPNSKTLVSYALGTLLRKMTSNQLSYSNFKPDVSSKTVYSLLDFVFYLFTYSPTFDNAQKLISLISYINDEFKLHISETEVLQRIIEKYSYIFSVVNVNDATNLLLLCARFDVEISYVNEALLLQKIIEEDNPIIMANYLIYSQYNASHNREITIIINSALINKVNAMIRKNSMLTYREFWWLLIFNKCPHIDPSIQFSFDTIISENLIIQNPSSSPDIINDLIGKFLLENDKQFFEWDIENIDIMRQITFRTQQRTLFKNYKYGDSIYEDIY